MCVCARARVSTLFIHPQFSPHRKGAVRLGVCASVRPRAPTARHDASVLIRPSLAPRAGRRGGGASAAGGAGQVGTVDLDSRADCMAKFVSNQWVGAAIFAAIVAGKLL